ncbi:hypothetical protein [Micromonospora aurantiaca (nom. illeg.)]|uniref:hypothetical protein n=1 Tax=Micromonospora aurantiaca (nom. illeg.) TaxID=47850 RepID=UPI0033E62DBC
MTAHPDRSPQPLDRQPTDTPTAIPDDSPRVAGDVPITVWRLDNHTDDPQTTEPDASFASRLAQRLVLIYTRHGDTVVALEDDPHLQTAATEAGRTYLPITDPAHLADLDQTSQPVTLVTLRWPRDDQQPAADRIADLFTACRLMMIDDACIIAAIRPRAFGATFADHEHMLRATAHDVGITNVLHIVAVCAAGEGDRYTFYATETEADDVTRQALSTPGRRVLHVDLMVFTAGGGATAKSDPTPTDRDPQRRTRRRHHGSRDVTRIAANDEATRSTEGGESSYCAAALTGPTSRGDLGELQSPVRVERTPDPCPPCPPSTPVTVPHRESLPQPVSSDTAGRR